MDATVAVRPLYGATVAFRLDLGERSVPIVGSLVEIRQVVTNLLINARDAVDEIGQVALPLTIEDARRGEWGPRDGAAPLVRLSVTDTCLGVPETVREKLFEPFVTSKATGRGSGLGLSSSQAIAFRHQGTLVLDP